MGNVTQAIIPLTEKLGATCLKYNMAEWNGWDLFK